MAAEGVGIPPVRLFHLKIFVRFKSQKFFARERNTPVVIKASGNAISLRFCIQASFNPPSLQPPRSHPL